MMTSLLLLVLPGVAGYSPTNTTGSYAASRATAKMLLDAYVQSAYGFSEGHLHIDFTFKLVVVSV